MCILRVNEKNALATLIVTTAIRLRSKTIAPISSYNPDVRHASIPAMGAKVSEENVIHPNFRPANTMVDIAPRSKVDFDVAEEALPTRYLAGVLLFHHWAIGILLLERRTSKVLVQFIIVLRAQTMAVLDLLEDLVVLARNLLAIRADQLATACHER